jgi:hypothetical protein
MYNILCAAREREGERMRSRLLLHVFFLAKKVEAGGIFFFGGDDSCTIAATSRPRG